MCRPKDLGGRRCDTHLKALTSDQLQPSPQPDLPPLAWAGRASEEPAALYASYDSQVVNAALNALLAALRHEPHMTEQLQTSLAGQGARLSGLSHRLKAPSSLARKIELKSRQKMRSPERVAATLDDSSRYTVTTARMADLVPALIASVNSLVAHGWTVRSAEHSYVKGNPYKGIHIILANLSGHRCEVQYHTDAALTTKNRGHEDYEIYRDMKRSDEDRKRAFQRSVRRWDDIPTPPGLRALKTLGGAPVVIKDYRF